MNLLNYVNELWGYPSLKGVAVIGAQHIMESTLIMFRNLVSCGLDARKTFLIGKCYSTSDSIYQNFYEDGIYVCPSSFVFDSHQSYDILYRENIRRFVEFSLKQIRAQKIRKLVVLDDGGYLIDAFNAFQIEDLEIVAIEQTSSGIHHLKNRSLTIPVINVARSKAKLALETPFIVESLLNRLWKQVNKHHVSNIVILGYGAIGREVESLLKQSYKVQVYDPICKPETTLTDLLQDADLIIGCSGTTALKSSDYVYLKKGSYLVSFSSSDREFDAQYFRKLSPRTDDCLRNFTVDGKFLLQAGFPINFWGSRNNIPFENIQLTLALLTSSIYQAIHSQNLKGGIHSIQRDHEDKLMSAYSGLRMKKSAIEYFPYQEEVIATPSRRRAWVQ